MKTRKHLLCWVMAALWLGACSDPDEEAAAPVSSQDFAASIADGFCSGIAPCCSAEGYDASNCSTNAGARFSVLVNELTALPGVNFDEAEAGRCVQAFRSLASSCNEQVDDRISGACDGVFVGTVPVGGNCTEGEQCMEAEGQYVYCDTGVCTEDTGFGAPADLPRRALGQPCNATCDGDDNRSRCADSGASAGTGTCWVQDALVCAQTGECGAAPTLGQACTLFCEEAAHCESGMCVADTATGPCNDDDDCLSGSYCDYEAMICTPLKANGELCDSSSECLGGQCDGDRCKDFSLASAESCGGLVFD